MQRDQRLTSPPPRCVPSLLPFAGSLLTTSPETSGGRSWLKCVYRSQAANPLCHRTRPHLGLCEADPVFRTELDDLLDDVALLVHFDRIDAAEGAIHRSEALWPPSIHLAMKQDSMADRPCHTQLYGPTRTRSGAWRGEHLHMKRAASTPKTATAHTTSLGLIGGLGPLWVSILSHSLPG